MKINGEEWHELHPDKPQPKKNKKCKILVVREGTFSEKSDQNTFEFKVDPKGIHKILAWKEINE